MSMDATKQNEVSWILNTLLKNKSKVIASWPDPQQYKYMTKRVLIKG